MSLIEKSRIEIKLGDYGVAPATAVTDPSLLPRVQDYRRHTGSRMYPLDKDEIKKKVPSADYHVSRKIDGEFTVFVYDNGESFTMNPGGTVRLSMPWQDEACKLLSKARVKKAMVAGELYVEGTADRRPRVHDVTSIARQPESQDELNRLRFAVFDIISIDDNPPANTFDETWQIVTKIFDGGESVHPVEAKYAKDADGVQSYFHRWVEEQGAEGIVVRSDTAGLFKIKPRHTLDVGVIGFTESSDDRQGMMHDLLLAVMRRDETMQVLCRVGGGFSDDLRREMFSDLKDMVVESEYAEVNSDHVAYQMVEPNWVIEISCLDLVSQTTRGGPVNRMVLNWANGSKSKYEVIRRLPLASVISPQFIRRREDKTISATDIRIQQVADLVEVPLVNRDAGQMTLPKSEIMRREVFTKEMKGETMVRKFLMWKTNKENESEDFPAYVVHYTDFSPNRKTPLSREVRVSNSVEQIGELWDKLVDGNIKKGWELYSGVVEAQPEEPDVVKIPAKKKTTKKKATKKAATKKTNKTTKKAAPVMKKVAKKKTKKSSKKKT